MKKDELNKILEGKTSQEQVEILKWELKAEKNQREIDNTNKKWWRAGAIVLFIFLLIILFFSKCSGDKMVKTINDLQKAKQELMIKNVQLEAENDCLKKEVKHRKMEIGFLEDIREVQQKHLDKYENQKPAVIVTRTTKNGNPATRVKAAMVNKSSNIPSQVTIEDKIIEVEADCEECLENYLEFFRRFIFLGVNESEWNFFKDSIVPILETLDFEEFEKGMRTAEYEWEIGPVSRIEDDSIEVVMKKDNPEQTWEILRKSVTYQDMLNMPVNPVISGYNVFIEYWENPYRRKTEKSFRNGLIFSGIGLGLYGTTEIMGHPVFRDYPADNSAAKRKSNTIMGLRIGAGVAGTLALTEFGRAWHFHRMEGKYIISPTEICLSVNLNRTK